MASSTRTHRWLEGKLLKAGPVLGTAAGLLLVRVPSSHRLAATVQVYAVHAAVGAAIGLALAGFLVLAWRSNRAGGPARANSAVRAPIPERVRHEVWRRDRARCVDCGSRARLEFDHIIPLSRGGSSTARNLELRCETCNRRKGARI